MRQQLLHEFHHPLLVYALPVRNHPWRISLVAVQKANSGWYDFAPACADCKPLAAPSGSPYTVLNRRIHVNPQQSLRPTVAPRCVTLSARRGGAPDALPSRAARSAQPHLLEQPPQRAVIRNPQPAATAPQHLIRQSRTLAVVTWHRRSVRLSLAASRPPACTRHSPPGTGPRPCLTTRQPTRS